MRTDGRSGYETDRPRCDRERSVYNDARRLARPGGLCHNERGRRGAHSSPGQRTRALTKIRVNAVSPGAFPTKAEQIYEDPEAYSADVIEHQSLRRRGRPEELAAVVSFLAGDDSSFVTGQTIEVNGGWVMT